MGLNWWNTWTIRICMAANLFGFIILKFTYFFLSLSIWAQMYELLVKFVVLKSEWNIYVYGKCWEKWKELRISQRYIQRKKKSNSNDVRITSKTRIRCLFHLFRNLGSPFFLRMYHFWNLTFKLTKYDHQTYRIKHCEFTYLLIRLM